MSKILRKNFKFFCTYLLAKEAERRGIKVTHIIGKDLAEKRGWLDLDYHGHREQIMRQVTSNTSATASYIADDKELTKYFLKKAGLNTAKGRAFTKKQTKELIKYAGELGFPVVLKPSVGTHGAFVTVGIKSKSKLRKAVDTLKKKYKKACHLIVEKQFFGTEYRLFATKYKFLAATNRVPANVIGDGQHTLQELIDIKNSDPLRGNGHEKTLLKIKITEEVHEYLKEQKKNLGYIPKNGEQVFLRKNSNLSTGGDSIDVTDLIHPSVKKIAVQVIKAIPGLTYAGLDFLTKDVTKPQTKSSYIIIEVNSSPMLSMHHIPAVGEKRDIAKEIIDLLYPETKGK